MNGPRYRLGVVMDPIESIQPKKDSTFAMLLAAQRIDWEIVYFLQRDLIVRDGVAYGDGRYLSLADHPERWFELGGQWSGELGGLDVILMRKDPPFDMEYIYSSYILGRAEQRGALLVNTPSSLREINEKASTSWFAHCTPPSLIARSEAELRTFLEEHGKVVFKPLDGMGGRSIFVVDGNDINASVITETLTEYGTRFILAQRHIPEIAQGDKRILLIDGIPIDYALARIPAPGESRGNLVLGATGEGRALTERDRWICAEIGPTLVEHGVTFAGIDVIGDYLTEINVTSPTGIRELDREYGIDIAGQLMMAIRNKLVS